MNNPLAPEIRMLDGKPVYFYNLTQLEAIRDKHATYDNGWSAPKSSNLGAAQDGPIAERFYGRSYLSKLAED